MAVKVPRVAPATQIPEQGKLEPLILKPAKAERNPSSETDRLVAQIVGPTREDRLRSLLLLRAGQESELDGLTALESKLRVGWWAKHPEQPILDGQRPAVQRRDFFEIVDNFQCETLLWDTTGWRPWTNKVVLTGVVRIDGQCRDVVELFGPESTTIFLRLTRAARLYRPSIAVFKAFNHLAKGGAFSAQRCGNGTATLTWRVAHAPLAPEMIKNARMGIRTLGARLAAALDSAHQELASVGDQLELGKVADFECVSEVYH